MNELVVVNKPTPRPDQIADLAYFINNPKAGLLHDPGVGKTITAAVFTEYRWKYFQEKAVWVMPVSLLKKNKDELIRFTSFEPEDIVIVQGTKEKKEELLRGPGKIWLMSGTGYSASWVELLQYHPDIKVNVIDEFHLIYAGHTSARTQSWYIACRQMNALMIMSGTLIKGRLSSAYPMIHVVAPLYYGSYEGFLAQHAILDQYGRIAGWMNHEKLRNVLGTISIRRSFESVYGVEHPVIQTETCEMSPKIRAKYNELEQLGVIELENSMLEATSAIATLIRCRQIMACPEIFQLMKSDELTGKDERMMIHVEDHIETGERLVIFAALIPEQERIYRHLQKKGLKVAIINGTVSGAERQRIDADFRAGRLQFIVGSAATMGVGFNWPFLRMVLFASLDYGDDTFTQAYKRGIRAKRETPLLVIVLEYRNSIDQQIFKIIERKAKDYSQVDETKPEIFLQAKKNVENKTGGKLSMGDL